MHRVAHPESVAELARRLLTGAAEFRRQEAILNTPRAVNHEMTDGSARGVAAATSVLVLSLHELDGTFLERGVAADITRRILRAYLDQIERTR